MEDNQKSANHSLSYQLYLHREELRRRPRNKLRLAKIKMHLTTKLIDVFALYIFECQQIELQHIDRQLKYEEKLLKKIRAFKKHQREKKLRKMALAAARQRHARAINA